MKKLLYKNYTNNKSTYTCNHKVVEMIETINTQQAFWSTYTLGHDNNTDYKY